MNNVITVEYACDWFLFCRLKINHASVGHMHLFLNTAPSQTHIITFGFFTVNKIFNGEALCSIWKSNCPLSFLILEASRWRKGMWGTILCTVFHQASGTIWQEPSRASTTAQSIRMQIWCSVTKPLRNVPQYDYFMMFRSVLNPIKRCLTLFAQNYALFSTVHILYSTIQNIVSKASRDFLNVCLLDRHMTLTSIKCE